MDPLLGVGPVGGWALPEGVVQVRRHRHRRRKPRDGIWTLRHGGDHAPHFPDASVADDLTKPREARVGAHFGVGTEDAAVVFHRVRDGAALGEAEGDRFFEGDVLAGAGGGDRHDGMPMVWRGDHHCVDVRPGE